MLGHSRVATWTESSPLPLVILIKYIISILISVAYCRIRFEKLGLWQKPYIITGRDGGGPSGRGAIYNDSHTAS